MANSNDFVAFVLEQMSPLGPVNARRMFGGHGLYLDGLMFALIDDDRLYLKADEQSRAKFIAKQTQPFTYMRQGEAASMSYYEAPAEVFDDRAEMLVWARMAYETALQAKSARPPKKKSKK